jgi:heme-degrading monooxygenase HmoA
MARGPHLPTLRASPIVADPAKAAADGGASYRAMVDSMKQVEGFLGALLLIDKETGSSLGLTFWQDEETLKASEEVANKVRRDGASTIGATSEPTVERFEVLYYGVPEARPSSNGR